MGSIAEDTQWMDATAQAGLVAAGEVSAGELTDAAIERIEALDGPINAVVMRWFERGRAAAAAIDAGGATTSGPFAGVPFLLKDLATHLAGTPLSNGNVALRDGLPISSHTTTLVERFADAGLVTLGRTNSPELGSVPVTEPIAYGPTRNPFDTGRTPGGSSGGAAAAVAAGMVPIAHATDGGGSIRIPASCCGLVGLKPSQGRITSGPDRDESGLSVGLCVSRTVRDTARLLDAVHGPGVGDSVIAPPPARAYAAEVGADPGRLRIGMLDHHPQGVPVDDDCARAVLDTAAALEAAGHAVEPAFPEVLGDPDVSRQFMTMWSANAALGISGMGDMLGRPLTEHEVEPVNWAMAQFAAGASSVDHAAALVAVMRFRRRLRQWWSDGWDLLLTPTLAQPPLAIGSLDPTPDDPLAGMRAAGSFSAFTPPYNLSGQPAISLPMHRTAEGLPIGVQLVADYGREDVLIRIAAQLEAAAPWAEHRPAT